ncbi:hypothetical protein [Ruegeria sp. HKCCD6604]|uniref:hypothetical protein n=1 Tax=Ruegeria sp. HKCCD6604 TaxID=2683000 RepID=UPI001491108C|nr:hypothetical protein [Ruegeria sp. HKCCD6604]NOC94481.1 hypothetical protein [Ruegeria sp. HKCCD6604]
MLQAVKALGNKVRTLPKLELSRKVTLPALVTVLITTTDLFAVFSEYVATRKFSLEGTTLFRTEEEFQSGVMGAAAYLKADLLLTNWPSSGAKISAVSRVSTGDYIMVPSRTKELKVDHGGIAGVKSKFFSLPSITTDGEVSLLCFAQQLNEVFAFWSGRVVAVLPNENSWEELSGQALNSYFFTSEGKELISSTNPGNNIVKLQRSPAKVVTLNRFTSFGSNPCNEGRFET